jgi:hypothetical protein
MSFEIEVPQLNTIPASRREKDFVTLENKLRAAARVVDRFNGRVLDTIPLLVDVQWLALTTQLLIETKSAPDLDLGEQFNVATLAGILRRLSLVMPDTLLHPSLSTERGELPKKPRWAFNDMELLNPFLPEVSDLSGIMEDQLALETHDPELAKLLKQEAEGGLRYHEYFAVRERDKLLKAARGFSKRNPFMPGNSVSEPNADNLERAKEIQELHRTNRVLAEQLERESKLAGCNPFGRRLANSTIGMKFHKTDPKLGALLEAAASFEEAQSAAEFAESDALTKKRALALSEAQRTENLARRGR